ncbi:MAG: aliphatic sulfonate ABC transporter substrate-binding protein [Solibacillus sp.]
MKKWTLALALLLVVAVLQACSSSAETKELETVRLDYAYYSPTSLILKNFGYAEEIFEADGVKVEWTLSQGSNKALEFLTSNSIDFGSAAGAATLITKSKDVPLENVYVLSQPEWTALTTIDPSIQSIEDLKGKKVAATYGTDPYIFLLRALDSVGLSEKDIEYINLQHQDGYQALVKGDIDAWAGLDPIMATSELESGAKLFYRNTDFNTYNFLNVRSEFADNYPEAVEKVIQAYEKAREWIIANPEEAAEIIAKEAQIDLAVAKLQLERTGFDAPIPGAAQQEALEKAGALLQAAEIIPAGKEVTELTTSLINPTFAEKTVK